MVNTEEQKIRLSYLIGRLNSLRDDFIQAELGAKFDDLEDRKSEFIRLHNELRILLDKEPRIYS